jgi:hypothetical protein
MDTFGAGNSRLTSIGASAFNGAATDKGPIDTLYFHKGITTIGNGAFTGYGSNEGPSSIYTANTTAASTWSATAICGASSTATIDSWSGI